MASRKPLDPFDAEPAPSVAVATLEPPRVPAVGDQVFLVSIVWPMPNERVVAATPAKVARVLSPGDPASPLDLETTATDIYRDVLAVPHMNTARLLHWCLLDADGEPTRVRPDRKPEVGQGVAILLPDHKGARWRTGRVVEDHMDGEVNSLLDIAVDEVKLIPNVSAGGDPPGDRTWAWTSPVAAEVPDPTPDPETDHVATV